MGVVTGLLVVPPSSAEHVETVRGNVVSSEEKNTKRKRERKSGEKKGREIEFVA